MSSVALRARGRRNSNSSKGGRDARLSTNMIIEGRESPEPQLGRRYNDWLRVRAAAPARWARKWDQAQREQEGAGGPTPSFHAAAAGTRPSALYYSRVASGCSNRAEGPGPTVRIGVGNHRIGPGPGPARALGMVQCGGGQAARREVEGVAARAATASRARTNFLKTQSCSCGAVRTCPG